MEYFWKLSARNRLILEHFLTITLSKPYSYTKYLLNK